MSPNLCMHLEKVRSLNLSRFRSRLDVNFVGCISEAKNGSSAKRFCGYCETTDVAMFSHEGKVEVELIDSSSYISRKRKVIFL